MNRKSMLSDVTIGVVIIIFLILIALGIFFSKVSFFKDFLGF